MKTDLLKLVYFSPTGTTRTIIEAVAGAVKQGSVETMDITKPEARKQRLLTGENELLVIGVPVYGGRVPAVVIDWLDSFEAHNTPVVCLVVYGNREYEDALLELKDTMESHGCVPVACAAFIGEHSFSGSGTPIAAARPDAADVSLAESFGKKVNERLLSSASHGNIAVPGNHPYKDFKAMVLDFIAVSDSCSQCGSCVQVCPAGAVDAQKNFTADIQKCILCCACIKNCPQSARSIKEGKIMDIAIRLNQTCGGRKEPAFFF